MVHVYEVPFFLCPWSGDWASRDVCLDLTLVSESNTSFCAGPLVVVLLTRQPTSLTEEIHHVPLPKLYLVIMCL